MSLLSVSPSFWETFTAPDLLHIPDGFLTITVSILFWLLTVSAVGAAVRAVQSSLGERQIPLIGVLAATIFAAQMVNFPVAGGTSGHMVGGALAAIVLGPWAGILAMTAVVAVQALLFQDGGLLVMGANIFDMGILTAAVGYGVFRLAEGNEHRDLDDPHPFDGQLDDRSGAAFAFSICASCANAGRAPMTRPRARTSVQSAASGDLMNPSCARFYRRRTRTRR